MAEVKLRVSCDGEAIPHFIEPHKHLPGHKELDEQATMIQALTGYSLKRLLDLFAAGYTLKPPEPSASLADLADLAEEDES